MRFWRTLRKFNMVAFAVLCLILIIFAGLAASEMLRSGFGLGQYDQYGDASVDGSNDPDAVNGDLIDFNGRTIAVYARGDMHEPFMRRVRIIDMRSGTIVKLTANDQQKVYGGEAVGPPDGRTNSGLGYFAKLESGAENGMPLFDLVYVRFSDLKTFRFATGVAAADALTELDAQSFSLVIWDKGDKGRFVVFDTTAGAIVATRDLDRATAVPADSRPSGASADQAPVNKFHFGAKE